MTMMIKLMTIMQLEDYPRPTSLSFEKLKEEEGAVLYVPSKGVTLQVFSQSPPQLKFAFCIRMWNRSSPLFSFLSSPLFSCLPSYPTPSPRWSSEFSSENRIIFFRKLNFSRQDELVYGEKISPDKWSMWLWLRNGGRIRNCQDLPAHHQQPKT